MKREYKYWLGPGVLRNRAKDSRNVMPGEKIPDNVFADMPDALYEKYVKRGKIGDLPQKTKKPDSKALRKARKKGEAEKAGLLEKINALVDEKEKLAKENAELKAENKKLDKALKAAEKNEQKLLKQVEKLNNQLKKAKDKNAQE